MPKVPHGKEIKKELSLKGRGSKTVYNPKNFISRGATSEDSGVTPNESPGMGFNYGVAKKNNMGRMRSNSIGYIPVSKEQLGTPPRGVV